MIMLVQHAGRELTVYKQALLVLDYVSQNSYLYVFTHPFNVGVSWMTYGRVLGFGETSQRSR